MKLISLNTWGGKLFDPLIQFIKTHSHDTDIFCFQEVFKTTLPKNLQYITFTKSDKNFIVCNVHGIWLKEGKEDSISRLKQSKKLISFLLNRQVKEF